ncbi:carbohydrate ABC transporter permease [Microbacterium betulae]|uniref:Carbohydrate ABC transporter permease n=1 Tax=Microbacterium betulae TaxID=2981139 RepID=A0AA97FJK1_9MICO|nr:carbohydrate ABC transporter permease [Microbacterium sp. AB]WOF24235.1 carbohydrate ABC transporter permease [Microbacterium sp. AB]
MSALTAARAARTTPESSIAPRRRERRPVIASIVLVLGAIYCLVPVLWVVVASTKSNTELFTTFTFAPGTGLFDNLADLFRYGDGQFGIWALNSVVYAGGGALLSTLVSTMAGYALAKYDFPGRQAWFYAILAGVLLPGITLAIPQYLLMSRIGLAGSYWSVLLPSLISPFGIFLARVYAASAIPSEMMEAARIDGAGDLRVFASVALPMMVPGMVTIFLLQFVGIWNNFLLPFIMLSDERMYPLTVGLYTLLSKGSGTPSLYSLAVIGAAVSIIPLIIMMLVLQRYWRLDLVSGGLKG